MKLAELQTKFCQHLLHQPVDLSALNITGPLPVEQLMSLYRNNFYVSLTDYLKGCFPSVNALVGEEFFAQLAKAFIIGQPLANANIELYGADFSEFIDSIEQTRSLPYLAGIAALDWGFDRAKGVTEIASFPFVELEQLTEQQQLQIRFQMPAETLLLASDYPLLSIWQGVKKDCLEGIDMDLAEYLILQPSVTEAAVFYPLSASQYKFLSTISTGISLEQLADTADFQLHLNHFIGNAVINGFTAGDE
ncbi:MAG: DNA-binding domain-containing protein [Pseudomonadales bacterium]|nr:DNA-binding domain-containing protein [Pseudomonadales bacterium]NRA16154.1 putative DNA-binding domain-containing protein [Oceanospirillaceae bacterium]